MCHPSIFLKKLEKQHIIPGLSVSRERFEPWTIEAEELTSTADRGC
jgi:hypothetical protein